MPRQVDRRRAAACGAAMEVPEMVFVPVSLSFQVDVMSEPGAYRSTTEPKFENEDCLSSIVLDATVIASVTRDGEP